MKKKKKKKKKPQGTNLGLDYNEVQLNVHQKREGFKDAWEKDPFFT